MIKHATAAKIAVSTCALDIAQTEMEGTALIKNADKTTSGKEVRLAEVRVFFAYRGQRADIHIQIIKEIAASGIKVIIANASISDLALHHLNSHSIAVLKVPSKFELRRLCRVVNAIPLNRMGAPTPEEEGWVDVYETVDFDGDRLTVLRQLVAGDPGFEKSGKRGDGKAKKIRTATIVLRGGGTAKILNDLESAIDNGMNLIKSLLTDRRLVPGAGATELELAKRMYVYGSKMKGQQRHAVKRFAMALEVIPRALAENAAVAEREGNKILNPFGGEDEASGNIEGKPPSDGTILADSNTLSYPILDSLAVKCSAINHAVGAVVSVLNVDSSLLGWQAVRRNWGINMPLIIFDFKPAAAPLSGPLEMLLLFILFIMINNCILFISRS
jgi:chaperonin GroEL (HSP60 family)